MCAVESVEFALTKPLSQTGWFFSGAGNPINGRAALSKAHRMSAFFAAVVVDPHNERTYIDGNRTGWKWGGARGRGRFHSEKPKLYFLEVDPTFGSVAKSPKLPL